MIRFWVLLAFFFSSINAWSQHCRPKAQDVIWEYCSNFSSEIIDYKYHTTIAYKKDGIYILLIDVMTNQMYKEFKYYDFNSCKYLPENLAEIAPKIAFDSTISIEDNYQKFLHNSLINLYDCARINYMGYSGSEYDMISEYATQDISKLNDTIIEGLARSYSKLSTKYNKLAVFGDPIPIPNEPFTHASINSSQRKDSIDKYILLSANTYKILAKKNPNHMMITGNAVQKAFNEYMAGYLNYLAIGDENRGNKFINMIDEDSTVLEYSKSILDSVKPNAIIFSFGDNDTYPFYYCQKKYNYRSDITVLNLSLLSNKNYYESYIYSKLQLNGIHSLPLLMLNNEKLQKTTLEEFIKNNSYSKDDYSFAPKSILTKKIETFPFVNKNWKYKNEIKLNLETLSYSSELKQLKIINEFIEKRPIYYATYQPILGDNFLQESYMYLLSPKFEESVMANYYYRNADKLFKNFIAKKNSSSNFKWDWSVFSSEFGYYINWIYDVHSKDTTKAKVLFYQLIDRYKDEVPNYYKHSLASFLLIVNDKKLANTYLKEYISWQESNPDSLPKKLLENKLIEEREKVNELAKQGELNIEF